jgi:hypothetical protein
MVKNLWPGDIALVEMLRGSTEAPSAICRELRARGYLEIIAGKPKLTVKGRRRAERLRPAEQDLRKMFASGAAANGAAGIEAPARSSLHIGGGRARIR